MICKNPVYFFGHLTVVGTQARFNVGNGIPNSTAARAPANVEFVSPQANTASSCSAVNTASNFGEHLGG